MSTRQPAIFFGHGNPMNALAHNAYTDAWQDVGARLQKPRAILAISAHWYIPARRVTAMSMPRTIHDFGGFPRELYEVRYPAPGNPELARRAQDLLGPWVQGDLDWGLDHGTWSVLMHVFPQADVPVVQLSLDATQPARAHFEWARRLAPLRDEGILIVGSGNIVHNLETYAWGRQAVEAYDWAVRFENKARELMMSGEVDPLIDYKAMGKDALLSAPTPDHYLPLLYVLAVRREDEGTTFPVEGVDGGSVSMLSVKVG
jgi:4,5-DOPA dioxygenase extradiol